MLSNWNPERLTNFIKDSHGFAAFGGMRGANDDKVVQVVLNMTYP